MENPFVLKPRLLSRPDRTGLFANVGFWTGLTLLVNGLIFGFGWTTTASPHHRSDAYELPGALVGTVWIILIALLAAARWQLLRGTNPSADRARWWLSALIVSCLLYPFYTLAIGSIYGGLAGNVVTIGLTGWVIRQTWPLSRPAAYLIMPVIGWILLATYTIFGELGWLS